MASTITQEDIKTTRRTLSKLIGSRWISEKYNVHHMTVFNWRKRQKNPMPYIRIKTGEKKVSIYFEKDKIEKWVSKYSKAKG